MNTSSTLKTVVAALAAAAALSAIAAPTAAAYEVPDSCLINNDRALTERAIDLTLDEGDVFNAINDIRQEYGFEPLEFDRAVAAAAVQATHQNVLDGYTPERGRGDSHGRLPGAPLFSCGAASTDWGYVARQETGVEVSTSGWDQIDAWKSNDEERAVLLNPKFKKMGVALGYNGEIGQVEDWNRVHWTVVFTD